MILLLELRRGVTTPQLQQWQGHPIAQIYFLLLRLRSCII